MDTLLMVGALFSNTRIADFRKSHKRDRTFNSYKNKFFINYREFK